jgi:hypothetical protein
LAPKKENRKMADMLERMGMIKKADDDLDAAVPEESAPASASAAPPSAAVDVKSAPARQAPPPAAQASAKTRGSAPKAQSSRAARKPAAPPPAPVVSEPAEPAAPEPAVSEPAAASVYTPPAMPVTPPAAATPAPAPAISTPPAVRPTVPPPAASVPPPAPAAPPVYTPPAAYQPPRPVAPPVPVPPPAPFVQRPPESPAYRAAYISPEAEKNLYAHLSVSNSYSFGNRSVPFEGAPGNSLIDSFWADTPAVDSTVDRYLDTAELYTNFRMKLSGIDTIYLIEEYMKTLPDSLPVELRRSIIIRIVASSGFDFEKLVNDGIDRVTRLNEYATQFAARTDEVVTRQNAVIEDLERQITAIRAEIDERKNLHKQQFLTIEDEAQRLKEILDFITK